MYNTASRHYVFSQRQFWTAYKLLENLLSWQGMLSTYHIEELVIDGLINRYLDTPIIPESTCMLHIIMNGQFVIFESLVLYVCTSAT